MQIEIKNDQVYSSPGHFFNVTYIRLLLESYNVHLHIYNSD